MNDDINKETVEVRDENLVKAINAIAFPLSMGIYGVIIMLLWNWVIVPISDANSITFFAGVGVALLISFISRFFKKSNNL